MAKRPRLEPDSKTDTKDAIRLARQVYREVFQSEMVVDWGKDSANVRRCLLALNNDLKEFLLRWRESLTLEFTGDATLAAYDLSSFCMPWRFNKIGAILAITRKEKNDRRARLAETAARSVLFREWPVARRPGDDGITVTHGLRLFDAWSSINSQKIWGPAAEDEAEASMREFIQSTKEKPHV